MLVRVHVDFLIGEGDIGSYIIREFHDFNGNALFGSFFFDLFHDFRMDARCDPDSDFFFVGRSRFGIVVTTATAGSENAQRSEGRQCYGLFDE